MNGVDHKDRDTADYSISVKSNRWYMRIFFWLVDNVIHAMYTNVTYVARNKDHPWFKYKNKNGGRYKFQYDLALELMEYGIKLDWKDLEDDSQRPPYIRQKSIVPCECKSCFFCKNGITTGIDHRRVGKKRLRTRDKIVTCSGQREMLHKHTDYCRMCYNIHRTEDKKAKFKEIRALSTVGALPFLSYISVNKPLIKKFEVK